MWPWIGCCVLCHHLLVITPLRPKDLVHDVAGDTVLCSKEDKQLARCHTLLSSIDTYQRLNGTTWPIFFLRGGGCGGRVTYNGLAFHREKSSDTLSRVMLQKLELNAGTDDPFGISNLSSPWEWERLYHIPIKIIFFSVFLLHGYFWAVVSQKSLKSKLPEKLLYKVKNLTTFIFIRFCCCRCSPRTRTEVFVRMELHPSLASVLMDFQGNYVNGNRLFVPIV